MPRPVAPPIWPINRDTRLEMWISQQNYIPLALMTIIQIFYDQEHLHSALGYLTPSEFKQSLQPDAASGGGVC